MIRNIILVLALVAISVLSDLVDMKDAIVFPKSRLGLISHPYYPVWAGFKDMHRKSYLTLEEELARFTTFLTHHQEIELHNREFQAGRKSYELEMNQYGDLTAEEFRAKVNGFKGDMAKRSKQGRFGNAAKHNLTSGLPESIDWREKGYVTGVKDQGDCGSCWSFSAAGALEGQYFKKSGKLVDLSEQNLVDCDYGNSGCNGGLMDVAFDYVKAHGIETYRDYPYRGRRGHCRADDDNAITKDQGYVDLPEGDESALEAAIAEVGPISVAIDASRSSFRFYKRGVYDDPHCSRDDLDHAVLAVGYGVTESGQKYYIVKNSWSEEWGENGYVRMSRGKNNQCGIADFPSYPLV